MSANWPIVELSNIADVIDSRHKTPTYSEDGYPMVRVVDVKGGVLDLSDTKKVTDEVYEDFSKGRDPEIGDLVISRVGSYGNISYVATDDKFCLGQNTALIIPKINSRFLYYQLVSPLIKHQIDTMVVGAVQKTISLKNIKQLQIHLPDEQEQKAIAHILGSLDDKIELNRQMNATLEAMAQALFKSWFVDFDPVIDNALAAGNPIPEPLQARAQARKTLTQTLSQGERASTLPSPSGREAGGEGALPAAIQQQFPSRFVFNDDLGWVPEGWGVGVFGNVAIHIRDNVNADEVGDFDFYVGLEHIGRKQLFLSNHASGESIESNKSLFAENDLLFGKLRPYFHKVCLAPQDGICSTDILVFRAKNRCLHSFMTLTAYQEEFVEFANLRSTGTRMPRASAKDMLNYPICVPPRTVVEAFEAKLAVIWEKGMQTIEQSHDLAKIRDTLLPKLLSGQLRIPAAEKLIESVQ